MGIASDYQFNTIHIVPIAYIFTFDGYGLIIQIINHIPFIYFAVYAKFSINMVNPYGGQYIVLSSIESITVLRSYCWLILCIFI